MALQVIGAGFGRTGTHSLKIALEKLGYNKCYHMVEVFENPEDASVWQAATDGKAVDWDALFDGYQAGVDWPIADFWRELSAYYPDAKFVLGIRDADSWYKSVSNTIFKYIMSNQAISEQMPLGVRDTLAMIESLILDKTFQGDVIERDHVIGVYNRHNEEVMRGLPADRLLVFEAAEGWEPLCAFLGCPVPQEPYPRTNSTEEFMAEVEEERRAAGIGAGQAPGQA